MENVFSEGGINQIIGNYLIVGIVVARIFWDVISYCRAKLYNDSL